MNGIADALISLSEDQKGGGFQKTAFGRARFTYNAPMQTSNKVIARPLRKLLSVILLAGSASAPAEVELPLWHGAMPGRGAEKPESAQEGPKDHVLRVSHVSKPTLTLYRVEAEEPTPLVIVCPGGGYHILAFDLEGTEIAEWLNSIGVSAAVLKYRVPQNRKGALEDARRAVRMVREKSGEWQVTKIGMIGFSAGAHLTAACSNSADRPDFSVLVYPAYLYQPGGIALTEDIRVDRKTPPAFVVQTLDDKKFYRSALAYTTALDAQGVPCELHLFARGGHGYGLRDTGHSVSRWPELCAAWLKAINVLPK